MVERHVFKVWRFECPVCGQKKALLQWDYEPHPSCDCGAGMLHESGPRVATAVHGDEIDIEIRHGICNEDGTPRRYRSKSEIKRVAAERGLTIMGETPKPASPRWI